MLKLRKLRIHIGYEFKIVPENGPAVPIVAWTAGEARDKFAARAAKLQLRGMQAEIATITCERAAYGDA